MLSSGCDDRECRVLLLERVRIGERATYPLRKSGWSCSTAIPLGCLTSGILLRRHSTRMSHIRYIPSGYFTSGTWRRMGEEGVSTSPVRHIWILWQRLPGEFRSHFAQCRGVLLKLPNMCDRHFEIFYFRYFELFFFRYLMSKSPNSPCNPPIIGFLSY